MTFRFCREQRGPWRGDEGSSCRRDTGCVHNITVAFGDPRWRLFRRVMRRGVVLFLRWWWRRQLARQKKRLTLSGKRSGEKVRPREFIVSNDLLEDHERGWRESYSSSSDSFHYQAAQWFFPVLCRNLNTSSLAICYNLPREREKNIYVYIS